MKMRLLLVPLGLVAGLLLSACTQSANPQTSVDPTTISPVPTHSLESIEKEIDNFNVDSDFPGYTQADLEN